MILFNMVYIILTLAIGSYGFFSIQKARSLEPKTVNDSTPDLKQYNTVLFFLPTSVLVYGLFLMYSADVAIGNAVFAFFALALLFLASFYLKKYSLGTMHNQNKIWKMSLLWFVTLNVLSVFYAAFLIFITYIF